MYDVWFVIKDFFDFASKYTTAVPSQQQQQQKQQQQPAHDTVFPLGRGSKPLFFCFLLKNCPRLLLHFWRERFSFLRTSVTALHNYNRIFKIKIRKKLIKYLPF